jgi:hypothetical protein
MRDGSPATNGQAQPTESAFQSRASANPMQKSDPGHQQFAVFAMTHNTPSKFVPKEPDKVLLQAAA